LGQGKPPACPPYLIEDSALEWASGCAASRFFDGRDWLPTSSADGSSREPDRTLDLVRPSGAKHLQPGAEFPVTTTALQGTGHSSFGRPQVLASQARVVRSVARGTEERIHAGRKGSGEVSGAAGAGSGEAGRLALGGGWPSAGATGGEA